MSVRHALAGGGFIAAAFGLSACEIGPDYHPPDIALAPFRNAPTSAKGRSAPSIDPWWRAFHDPVLERAIRRALDQNLDLSASLSRLQASRAAAAQADAQLAPQGNLSASVAQQYQSLESPIGVIGRNLPGYERAQRLHDISIGANWEIDVFGGLRRLAEAAQAEASASEAAHRGVCVVIVADTADAYLQIREYQARLRLAEDQVATQVRLLDLVRLRLTRGVATDREVAQAEALLYRARNAIPPLQAALDAQSNRLDVLMGAQPGAYRVEFAKPADIPAPSIGAVGADPADLLRRRPDLAVAERKLAAANARIGAAIAEYYPKISIAGLLGFESLRADLLFKGATFQPQALGALRWRLFDFGRIDAEIARADSAMAEALALYRAAVLRAAEEVENAFMSHHRLRRQIDISKQEIAALAKARSASVAAYEAGAIGLTDVLDADRQLLVARDSLAHRRAASARAAVAIFRALGIDADATAGSGGRAAATEIASFAPP
ncbi:MAG: RND transporter [Methylocystaceae bacterium]|nr:MAG: RND transporter [Methylocystaceae bacterium]